MSHRPRHSCDTQLGGNSRRSALTRFLSRTTALTYRKKPSFPLGCRRIARVGRRKHDLGFLLYLRLRLSALAFPHGRARRRRATSKTRVSRVKVRTLSAICRGELSERRRNVFCHFSLRASPSLPFMSSLKMANMMQTNQEL